MNSDNEIQYNGSTSSESMSTNGEIISAKYNIDDELQYSNPAWTETFTTDGDLNFITLDEIRDLKVTKANYCKVEMFIEDVKDIDLPHGVINLEEIYLANESYEPNYNHAAYKFKRKQEVNLFLG
jgi:hypothetical protein